LTALHQNAAAAIFADCPLPPLSFSLEVHPLSALPDSLSWADYLACDLPLAALPGLRQQLGLPLHNGLPCAGEALLTTCMPCGGQGECGACAVMGRRGYKLVCKDGPVLDLEGIEW
jgi:dihydroorotate dehydrogenase electron transfer subunit